MDDSTLWSSSGSITTMITNAIDAAVPSFFQRRPEAARQRIISTDEPYCPLCEGSLHDDELVQVLRRAALYATDNELVGLVRAVVRVLETSGRCLVSVPGAAAIPSSSSPLMIVQPGVYANTLQHQLIVLEALFQQQQEQQQRQGMGGHRCCSTLDTGHATHDEFWQETLPGLLPGSAVDASMPWTGASPTLTVPSPMTPLFFDPLLFEQEVEETNSSRLRQGSALIPPSFGTSIEESTAMMMMGHTIDVTPSRSTTTTTTSTATTTTVARHSFDSRSRKTSSVCEINVVSLVSTVCETHVS
jgi:hypothetical protein